MKLDFGAVARDAATGVARAWPWLAAAVLFRVACYMIEIQLDIAWTAADPQRAGLRSDSLTTLIVREVLDGLVLGVVVAAVLHALGDLPGGRLVRALRAWPTAFATGFIWSLPHFADAAMTATGLARVIDATADGLTLIALAIAALFLSVFLSYATGSAVVRGTGLIASFRDSLSLTRGNRWRLLLVSVGLTAFYSAGYYVGDRLGYAVRGPWTSFAAESLTVRSAGVLCFVVVAAVWANLDRMRRPQSAAESKGVVVQTA